MSWRIRERERRGKKREKREKEMREKQCLGEVRYISICIYSNVTAACFKMWVKEIIYVLMSMQDGMDA